jgi:hypothetical protein
MAYLARCATAGAVALTLAVGGCAGTDLTSLTGQTARTIEPGPAFPAGTVTGQSLPPPSGGPSEPAAPGQVAALPPAAPAPAPAGPSGLAGRWTYATLTQSCAMTFQDAGTPATSGPVRGAVSADPTCPGAAARARVFELQGSQVLVFSQAGVLILRLAQAGPGKLSGQNTIGETVTLNR